MSSSTCLECGIPEGLLLLDDYYPISQSYFETLDATTQKSVKRVRLNQGQCEDCASYQTHFDEKMLRAERDLFIREAKANPPVLLALSGGKDSLSALYLLTEVLSLPTRAFLYQNGFIPEIVVEQAKKMCDKYGVVLDIVSRPLFSAFQKEYVWGPHDELQARTGLDFCELCSQQIQRICLDFCEQEGLEWVVFGNKVYTQLQPYVSSIQVKQHKKRLIKSINLPFTVGLKSSYQQIILSKMGWQDPQLKGYTSNCLIPGLVEKARQERLKMHHDQGYIERELRSGSYTPEEAHSILAKQAEGVTLSEQNWPVYLPPSLHELFRGIRHES